jgi:hypothetical protein
MVPRLVVAVLLVAAAAAVAAPTIDVTGDWASNWDDVKLVRHGNDVHGTYVCCGGGTIEGRVYEGHIIRYHWKQPNGGEGEGIWEIVSANRLEGTWGSGQSDDDGGQWNLDRKPALVN